MEIRWELHCQVVATHIAGEVAEKQELENLLMWGEFSSHVMLDREIFTYVKMRNS